jgi:hypothetical protein
MRKGAWILALAAAFSAASHAQLPRKLPENGKLGELVSPQPFPQLQINSKIVRLAPGGRLYNEQNRTNVHNDLPQHAYVYFVEDMNGDVSRIYLLRPEELQSLQRAR